MSEEFEEFKTRLNAMQVTKKELIEWHFREITRSQHLRDRIAELEEVVKAVAHIGVDFGYGNYELNSEIIDKARVLFESKLSNEVCDE